jgi:hypothetical protein
VGFFASGPSREEIGSFRLSEEAVERVRHLLLKKSAGTLADDEADELDVCVQLDRLLLLIRYRALQQPTSRGA